MTAGSLLATNHVEPWGYYERLQAAGEIGWDEELQAWVVSSYELIKQMGPVDNALWEATLVYTDEQPPFGLSEQEWIEFMGTGSRRTLHVTRGDEHDRMHRWWMKAFSGRELALLGDELVRPVAHAQIDRFADLGRAELHDDFALAVAPRIMAAAFGLPWQDDAWLSRFVQLQEERMSLIAARTPTRSRGAGADTAALIERGFAAIRAIDELLRPFVEERRDGRGDDLISMIWAHAPELFGDGYETVDVVATVNTSFSGGSSTGGAAIASGIYLLLTDPELQARLRAGDRKVLQGFVEETLRLYGPSVWRPRFAKADTVLGEVEIKQGEMVIALFNAGGRDPRHYPHAGEADPARPAAKDHFGFGLRGARTCPGQGLARTQLATVFDVVLERLHDLRLDPAAEPPRFREAYVRRWRPLHAVFDR